MAVFSMRGKWGIYNVYVRKITASPGLSARASMQDMAQKFAAELETMVRLYPTQWFNFYDFWSA